ncbi:putative 4-hydroxyphenylacetate isomerase/decarboxylase [Oceanicola granulosus HTCC2516]|uniref:Putative 4-hydroxy-4-methyl-2-oxoglutarate aldolase n=1 Tax=Oceanicola granulosus (strain ATCC BAA-861 / DSM 15982 / KCTC 12143 / HTCC2516) TaxID=314256 RepID=Q2CHC3_OCEGH|nr:RraA family protein [Oceanicola granulosus]EAR52116.1 putative 4-hydroxyphenylacetate isomerase/decarboxylase [Oceanicola granulosus HTCC2516]
MTQQDDIHVDPYQIRKHFEPLRVADVCDGLDGLGYFNVGNVSQDIRPLFLGIKFWGVAVTLRCVPANKPMWPLETTEDVVKAHGHWFDKHGNKARSLNDHVQEGSVVVCDMGSAGEVGFWGSENALGVVNKGGVGIVTNGYARDTGELALQKTPICVRSRGRTIIPGRIEAVETQTPVGIGGAQVRPGDIVGCDDDGLVVVPIEVAAQVAAHGKEVLLADMRARQRRYDDLGMPHDETVDVQAMEAYFAKLG